MALVAQLFPLLEESRSVWTWRASATFSILLRLDSRCTCPRFGPLYRDSSLERPFRGSADLQTPRGCANPWPWSVEYYTTWYNPSFYHRTDTEMRFLTMRRSLLTPFWLGDRSTWQTLGPQLDRDQQSITPHDMLHPSTTGRTPRRGSLLWGIPYYESRTHVLSYGRFLTRVFKDADVDLSKETDFEAPSIYNTYDE